VTSAHRSDQPPIRGAAHWAARERRLRRDLISTAVAAVILADARTVPHLCLSVKPPRYEERRARARAGARERFTHHSRDSRRANPEWRAEMQVRAACVSPGLRGQRGATPDSPTICRKQRRRRAAPDSVTAWLSSPAASPSVSSARASSPWSSSRSCPWSPCPDLSLGSFETVRRGAGCPTHRGGVPQLRRGSAGRIVAVPSSST